MKFVFRNNTVERFFSKDYAFSGYDDISIVPMNCDEYVWWYQVPIKYERSVLAEEVQGYIEKMMFVLKQVEPGITFIALTMDILYDVAFSDNDYSLSRAVEEYNSSLYEAERVYGNLKVIDIKEFTRGYSTSELIDWKFYFLSQMGLNPKLSTAFKSWWEHKMNGIALRRKKCLVLDLDNTLWGGILGEDGIDGIKIGGDYPGKAFQYWQEALLQLSKSGVILAICSKNNEQDVFDVWDKNPYMVLMKDAFSAYRINWIDKATNIKELAQELNIGLDSLVFVDDNPAEQELVRQMLPMVCVPDFPEQPYMLPVFFKQLVYDYFKVYNLTEEDLKKTEQYKANARRVQAQRGFVDFDDFLKSLDIQITIEPADEFNIPRIAQMTQKTNQFNLTTKRYTDSDVRKFVSEGWRIWCLSVSDKFGDSGITGCVMINGEEIDSFLLSCRILGKGIEDAFAKSVFIQMADSGCVSLKAKYAPTAKNSQVKDFYDRLGFTCIGIHDDGSKDYQIDLTKADLSIKNLYHIIIR